MADWKYIMLRHETEKVTIDYPIIFPNQLIHSDVAEMMSRIPINGQRVRMGKVSAGFLNFMASGTYGHSESMNLESRAADRAIINLMPYAGGRHDAMLAIEPMMLMKHVEFCLARIKELNEDNVG